MDNCEINVEELYSDSLDVVDYLDKYPRGLCGQKEEWKNTLLRHIDRVTESSNLKLVNSPQGIEWMNTRRQLSWQHDLSNKLIVMDFFTYCCVNCIHVLPYIKRTENAFAENPGFVVVGVHSPKFPNEKDMESVKKALLRLDVRHAVINDPENNLWRKLNISCWPTVLIIGPGGQIIFALVGELQIERLQYLCQLTMDYLKMCDVKLDTTPLPLVPLNVSEIWPKSLKPENISMDGQDVETKGLPHFDMDDCFAWPQIQYLECLLYPECISSDGFSIMISDTGHHRIILLSENWEVQAIIGKGDPGLADGSYEEASFNSPRGTAFNKSHVYVADTGNHCIRMIDLDAKYVYTVFRGEGRISKISMQNQKIGQSLSENDEYTFESPWDVTLGPQLGDLDDISNSMGNKLYVAVAGSHQIWEFDLNDISAEEYSAGKCIPFAGSGKEECRNSSRRLKAGFAQPSGISYSTLYPSSMFVADSESSAIRQVDLLFGSVKTLVGGGLNPQDLFQYGDTDGHYRDAKLQHPIGVCVLKPNILAITDSYNHKIKIVDIGNQDCATLVGSGNRGNKFLSSFQQAEFDEPSGICAIRKKKLLLVADTNNHCIKVIDLKKKIVSVMPILWKDENSYYMTIINNAVSVSHPADGLCLEAPEIHLTFGGEIRCYITTIGEGNVVVPDKSAPTWAYASDGDYKFVGAIILDDGFRGCYIFNNYDVGPDEKRGQMGFSSSVLVCDTVNRTCSKRLSKVKFNVKVSDNGSNYFKIFIFTVVN